MSSKDLLSSYVNIFKAINQQMSYARLELCCKDRKVSVNSNHDLRVILENTRVQAPCLAMSADPGLLRESQLGSWAIQARWLWGVRDIDRHVWITST